VVLREQGVNGQIEMANAFERAGFRPFDVHMSDLIEGRVALQDFTGLVACGGFSYGDVLAPAVAGPPRSWSAARCVMPSPRSSRARTASPWACATAAR
jgi:phosphoribosylformylglycinamidine (FGAM) synthase-like amidotransferase family enzyme